MTLLNVMVRGENEDAAGGLWSFFAANDSILSLTVQTMTYTGQGGGTFPRARHIPVDEAARIVAAHSGGRIRLRRLHHAAVGPSALLPDLLPRQQRRSVAPLDPTGPTRTDGKARWRTRT